MIIIDAHLTYAQQVSTNSYHDGRYIRKVSYAIRAHIVYSEAKRPGHQGRIKYYSE